jgi:hypothetical protein
VKISVSKKKYIAAAFAAGLALVVAWYLWSSGGLPLITLTPAGFAQFTQSFDGSADDARLVLLLSPT